jgi:hypothetical protein
VVIGCVSLALASTVFAAIVPGIATAALVGLLGASASSLAKVSLDAIIQRDIPEQSRASAFGRSEAILQLTWVFGGAIGILLPTQYWIGFAVISGLLALGLTQTIMVWHGKTLIPKFRRQHPATSSVTGP